MIPALASESVVNHTLQFTSLTKASVNFSATVSGQQDTDVNAKGKVIGYDMLYFTVVSTTAARSASRPTSKAACCTPPRNFSLNTGAVSDGKVTGGTGLFKGATGTLTARNLNAAGTRTAVKIVYHP